MKSILRFTGGLILLIGLFVFQVNKVSGDIVISNGTSMKVSAGTSVVVADNVELETGATLNNNGTFEIGGNFSNDGTSSLGNGSFVFNGTATQTISGSSSSEFGDLELDNSNGLLSGANVLVHGTLTLTNGVLDFPARILTLGSSSSVSGTFSASTMIATGPTAEVRKMFPDGIGVDPASFTFPVGEILFGTEYTPITIDISTGDFSSGYVGIRVVDGMEPNNTSADSYLERYWTIDFNGITNYLYDLTAQYDDSDIVGTEADISGGLYHGTGWYVLDPVNTGSNTFSGSDIDDDGNATGVEFRIFSDLRVFFQGAYRSATNEMTTDLNSFGFIPLTAAAAYSHIGYAGTESVVAIPSADVVDWILVEVRDAATPATATSGTAVETVAGFLMKDGSIVSTDGVSPIRFSALITNNAYFVIIPRNHLKIMTANSPSESFGNYIYDFTDASTKAYGTDAMIQLDTSPVVYGSYAGDVNASVFITNADKVPIDQNMDYFGFHHADCNYSAFVTNADKVPIDQNMNEFSQVPW